MSATIVARDLSAGHGARVLFSGLDLVVAPGDVVGLVGANGAGKSTLLRLLAGLDAPAEGGSPARPPGASVGYLPQETERRRGETVAALRRPAHRGHRGAGRMDAATRARSPVGGRPADDAYADGAGAVAAPRRRRPRGAGRAVAADVGLAVGPDALMTSPVRRQAARVGLAALLLSRYDVLPARRADQRPRPGRSGPTRAVRRRAARRRRRREPRPGVPGPHRDRRRRAGPRPAAGQDLRRRLRRPTSKSARSGAGTRARSTRTYAETGGRPDHAGADRSGRGRTRASKAARRTKRDNDRSTRVPGRPSRRSRPPRPGRPSG